MAEIAAPIIEGGKRARAKELNRQAILDAARIVFARLGYDACSIRDIIRETDLASGTFYNYFKSKEEVFETLASDSVRRFRPLLRGVREQASDLETYIESAYRAYFGFLARENDQAILDGTPHLALVGVRIDTPEMKAVSSEIHSDITTILQASGSADIDIDYLTAAAIGIAREIGDLMLGRRPIDAENTAQFATQLLLGGLQNVSSNANS
ncbi:MAG: TetR/AcrR family transcriptional regulator [Pseudomonadota bacterium]